MTGRLTHAAAALMMLGPGAAQSFRGMPAGELLRDREMPTLDGRRAPLLGKARASVVVFVRTRQDHSLQALRQLAQLEQELAQQPVRFVAVASGSEDRTELRALLAEAGVRMPLLLDQGDELYGEWSVALHPVVGIAGPDHRLVSTQHFLKINMLDAVRARIQHALGLISDAQLDLALHPPRPPSRPKGAAHNRVKLGRALLERGRVDQALDSARRAVESDPASAEAHDLLAEALAAARRCPEAEAARAKALALDPSWKAAALPGCPTPGAR